MSKARSGRAFTAQQKAEIVRRHLGGKKPVSKLAEKFGLQLGQSSFDRGEISSFLEHSQSAIGPIQDMIDISAVDRASASCDNQCIITISTEGVSK